MKKTIKVALVSGKNRYQTIARALDYFQDEIKNQITKLKKTDSILIKPNCVVSQSRTCATHPESLKALLDFLTPLWPGRFILSEGSAEDTMTAFKNYGYLTLKSQFPRIEFADLNQDNPLEVEIFDRQLRTIKIPLAESLVKAPLRISLGPVKTHDSAIVTLSIKNMAVGAIIGQNKSIIHQGPKAINRSLARLYQWTFPHLAINDGWQGMEANGPVGGQMLETHFTVASQNALAADVLTTKLMGFNPQDIGYLNFLGAEKINDQIEVLGENPAKFQFHFQPHLSFKNQLQWR